ncbi:hypothetical protein [Candidatus Uabimicrobium sp. HlEnr_7]|uniref:hypothetical protein n=1 Tax=Candidatus Uabimicrobium helgolandensis TaxID=3095367 RepID=UPI003555CB30
MYYFYLFLVWWHILGITVWLGANFFLVLVFLPVAKKKKYQALYPQLFSDVVIRLRTISWMVLSSVVLSGVFLMFFRFGRAVASWNFWQQFYGETLFIKLCLVVIVIIGSFLHDFYWGEKAIKLLKESPNSPVTQKMRRLSSYLGRAIFLLGLVIVFLAVKFVRGG